MDYKSLFTTNFIVKGIFIASLVILYIVTLSPYIPLFLIVDFFIRGFTSLKYSPLSWLAATISHGLKLPVVMTGKAKKIFSARVGFLFAVAIVLLFYTNPLSSLIVGGVLVGGRSVDSPFLPLGSWNGFTQPSLMRWRWRSSRRFSSERSSLVGGRESKRRNA